MKKCPRCGTTYTDESLRFCLADGAALNAADSEEPTVVSGRGEPLRVDITSGSSLPVNAAPPVKKSSPAIVKTVLILLIPVSLAFVVIAASVGVLYYTRDKNSTNNQVSASTPTPKPLATTDTETERLKNELANLQRQLDEKKDSTSNTGSFPDLDDLDFELRVATVNSPGDGFLALRSEPSSDYGERLAQIPHGAKINVVSCDSDKVTIGSRRGSWCLVEWSGRAGWVFDAWLTY